MRNMRNRAWARVCNTQGEGGGGLPLTTNPDFNGKSGLGSDHLAGACQWGIYIKKIIAESCYIFNDCPLGTVG